MKRFIVLHLVLSVFLWVSPALSGQLDEKKLLSTVYERFKWDKKIENLKLEQLSIQKKINVEFIGLSLWAVRINIKLETPRKEVQTGILDLVTDDKGQWQFENVSDLKTGYPFLEKALAELAKIDINSNIGQVILRGKGKKNIVMVIDNFCTFCRTAYQTLLLAYGDRVKDLVTIYLPSDTHPGAELACSVSSYVYSQKSLKQYATQVNNFIFQDLNPPTTKDKNEANALVYEAFKSKFPWFAKEFSGLTIEKAFEKLRAGSNIGEQTAYAKNLNIIGTPVLFVDGKRIDGLDWNKLERFLTY